MLILSAELLYNVRKKELERDVFLMREFNNKYHYLGVTNEYKKWTQSAIDCYERHCACDGCIIKEIMTSQKCMMKAFVLELVRLYGIPQKKSSSELDMKKESKS